MVMRKRKAQESLALMVSTHPLAASSFRSNTLLLVALLSDYIGLYEELKKLKYWQKLKENYLIWIKGLEVLLLTFIINEKWPLVLRKKDALRANIIACIV